MAAELVEEPTFTRDRGQVRGDFRFRLSGLEYDRLALSWWDPVSTQVGEEFSDESVVNVENKKTVLVPVYLPESYFTGDRVITFRLRDADEAEAEPLWSQDYRLLSTIGAERP